MLRPKCNAKLTKELIRILEGKHGVLRVGYDSLIDLAMKNKVLLQLLRVLNIQGPLRNAQEKAIREIVNVVGTISKTLKGYDYAFFKLIKLISYVPADVDVLVKLDEAAEAAKEVMRLGYKVEVKEPYCITLTKGASIVDLYAHPTVGGITYMDGQILLKYIRLAEFNGIEVKTLEGYAEALVTVAHALYKEHTYTLNDFFTVEKYTSKKSYKLAEELNCVLALESSVKINELIRKGLVNTPYRVPPPMWIPLTLYKFHADCLTRATSFNILRTLRDKRLGAMTISRLTRKTY
jgi:hypothetical protein